MEFHYFNFSYWRGDIPRLLIELGGIDVRDNPIAFTEAHRLGKFKELPALVVGDTTITQVMPIIRFLAKKAGFYPNNDMEAAKVDDILCLIHTISILLGETLETKITEVKPEIKINVEQINELIGNRQFVVGNSMTVADMLIWHCFRWVESGKLGVIPKKDTHMFKNIKRVAKNVEADARVIEWTYRQYKFFSFPG